MNFFSFIGSIRRAFFWRIIENGYYPLKIKQAEIPFCSFEPSEAKYRGFLNEMSLQKLIRDSIPSSSIKSLGASDLILYQENNPVLGIFFNKKLEKYHEFDCLIVSPPNNVLLLEFKDFGYPTSGKLNYAATKLSLKSRLMRSYLESRNYSDISIVNKLLLREGRPKFTNVDSILSIKELKAFLQTACVKQTVDLQFKDLIKDISELPNSDRLKFNDGSSPVFGIFNSIRIYNFNHWYPWFSKTIRILHFDDLLDPALYTDNFSGNYYDRSYGAFFEFRLIKLNRSYRSHFKQVFKPRYDSKILKICQISPNSPNLIEKWLYTSLNYQKMILFKITRQGWDDEVILLPYRHSFLEFQCGSKTHSVGLEKVKEIIFGY